MAIPSSFITQLIDSRDLDLVCGGFPSQQGSITSMASLRNDTMIAAASTPSPVVDLFDIGSKKRHREESDLVEPIGSFSDAEKGTGHVASLSGTDLLVFGSRSVNLYDVETGKVVWGPVEMHVEAVEGVCSSSFVVASPDALTLFDQRQRKNVLVLKDAPDSIGIAEGRVLLSLNVKGELIAVDLSQPGRPLCEVKMDKERMMRTSPDGRWISFVGAGVTVLDLTRMLQGESVQICQHRGHDSRVIAHEWRKDGKAIASADSGGHLHIWSV